MENLKYNLHKIATNNKLLIEVLADKTILNKQQHENFCNLFNDTQKLMLDTTICFLKLKISCFLIFNQTTTYLRQSILC